MRERGLVVSIRIISKVPGPLTVTIANQSGQGGLRSLNLQPACAQTSASSVRCPRWNGYKQFLQTKLPAADPLVVTITRKDGTVLRRVLSLAPRR